MDTNDKVLARVRKMLAPANNAAATEGERDNAMRMAHALLAKHNLSMAEAEASGGTEEQRGAYATKDRTSPWRRDVAHAVAGLYFCTYYFIRKGSNECQHTFFGRESNTVTAAEMAAYVIASIAKEGKAQQRAKGAPAAFYTSFVKGAAMRVAQRCAAIRAEAERVSSAAPATGTSLVLASLYAQERQKNEVALAELGMRLKATKRRDRDTGSSGFREGMSYGDRVGLQRQVTG